MLTLLADAAAHGNDAAAHGGHEAAAAMILTMVTAICGGVLLIVLARRINLPAIVLLLVGGVLLGPEVLGRWVTLLQPDSLGDGLSVIVSLAVGIILFEGGLTLDTGGYRSASRVIKRLLSFGVITTWLGTALAVRFIIPDMDWPRAILAGSLVIVTGPTVIAPLLKRIKITSRLHNILHWEGVLIDPIGVFIALLCFEWVSGGGGGGEAMGAFALRVVAGLAIGLAGGFLIAWGARKWVDEELINVYALGMAVGVFGAGEMVLGETGLLAVTVAGFVFGWSQPRYLKQIRRFKAELTDLLIGMLFLLLASRLEFAQFESFGLRGALVVILVLIVIRPLNVLVSSSHSGLSVREKAFLGWVAPRGIVAASMASLIQLSLPGEDRFIETFTYSVILSTVVLQGLSAGWVSRILKLERPVPKGWLIVGAHAMGRRVAAFIARNPATPAVIVDSSKRVVNDARNAGLTAIVADARDVSLADRSELHNIGNVLAMTDNEDLNTVICHRWAEVVGRDHVFRSRSSDPDQGADDDQEAGGIAVWDRLPKPTLLSAELQRNEATVIISSMLPRDMSGNAVALMTVDGDRVILDPTHLPEDDQPDTGDTLYLRREADYLARAVHEDLIVTTHAATPAELFTELIDHVVKLHPTLPRDETIRELENREAGFPTALGHGIAVPHAYGETLDTRICVIAQAPDGVDFRASDGEPVKLIFLLLSPQGDPEGHLATLAEIARLVVNPETREELVQAPSSADIVRVIREKHTG